MKRTKKYVLCLVVLLTVCMLSGCGTAPASEGNSAAASPEAPAASADAAAPAEAEEPAASTGEPVKLSIWMAGNGEPSMIEAYSTVYDAFCAENPNVSYELTTITWADYFTKLNTGLVGGAGPDIFMVGFGQAGTVHTSGNLLDLTPYIPADWDGYEDFLPNVLSAGEKDGKYFALFSPSTRVYLYRKDIAEQNGVTPEELTIKSKEDFFNLIRKMTVYDDAGNVEIFGLETNPGVSSEQDFFVQAAMFKPDVTLWGDDFLPNFSTPEGAASLDEMNKLYQEGVVCLRDSASTIAGVQTGVAAMALCPETTYVTADAAFPGQIGIVKNEMNSLLIGNYTSVNAATKYPAESAAMLLHMYSAESCKTFAEVMGLYSGRVSLDEHYLSLNPDYANAIDAYSRSYIYGATYNPMFNQGITFLRTALESVYHGTAATDVLASSQAEWAALYS